MLSRHTRTYFAAATLGLLSTVASTAWAYIGPGAGLSAIGSLLALLAAVLLGILGFVWYPIKRLLKKKSSTTTLDAESGTGSHVASDEEVESSESSPK